MITWTTIRAMLLGLTPIGTLVAGVLPGVCQCSPSSVSDTHSTKSILRSFADRHSDTSAATVHSCCDSNTNCCCCAPKQSPEGTRSNYAHCACVAPTDSVPSGIPVSLGVCDLANQLKSPAFGALISPTRQACCFDAHTLSAHSDLDICLSRLLC